MTKTTITIDKSLVLRVSWTRAYEAAIKAGTSVRQHLSAAMRSAWADWRECVADGEVRLTLTQEYDDRYGRMDRAMMRRRIASAKKAASAVATPVQQQACCDFAQIEFDPFEDQSRLVSASWIEADIILAGVEAERAGLDPRAAEIAAAAAHPPGQPTNGWLDEEVNAYVQGVLRELLPVEDATPRHSLTDLEIATTHAYAMSRAWIDLYDRECSDPQSVAFGDIFDARQRLQDAHARVDVLSVASA